MKPVLSILAAGLLTGSAFASNINLTARATANNSSAITVATGASVPFRVEAQLTDTLNDGLALVGFDLDFTGGDLASNTVNTPAGAPTCANPMPNFVKNLGITNPAGYGGTLIAGNLIQVGGGQNTIKNTAENADFPTGTVIANIAQGGAQGCPPNGPAIVAEGSLTAPMTPGIYTLQIQNVFANVIRDGETGAVFFATEAAGVGTVTNLTITVENQVLFVPGTWQSLATHARGVGEVGLVITADGNFSEPRIGIGKIMVDYNLGISAASVAPSDVTVAGRDVNGNLMNLGAHAIGTSVAASGNQLLITFTPALPDYARYRVTVNGIQTSQGGATAPTAERILTGLRGDANNDRRVTAQDVGGVRTLVGIDPISGANVTHVRSDANQDGRITAQDVGGIRALVGNDARFIANP